MGKKHNNHHIWWERTAYKDPIAHEFREYDGFVIPVFKTVHERLHDELLPPPKPEKNEMISCLGFLAMSKPRSTRGIDPLWAVERAMQHFVWVGANEPDREPVAHEIRQHLASQIGILSSGLYLGDKHGKRRKS